MKKLSILLLMLCILGSSTVGAFASKSSGSDCVPCLDSASNDGFISEINNYDVIKTEFTKALNSKLFLQSLDNDFTYIYERASVYHIEAEGQKIMLVAIPLSDKEGIKLGSTVYMSNYKSGEEAILSQYVDFNEGIQKATVRGDGIDGIVEETHIIGSLLNATERSASCMLTCQGYMDLGCAVGCLAFGGWAFACEYICGIAAEHTCDCYCYDLNCYGQPSAPDCGVTGKPDCVR